MLNLRFLTPVLFLACAAPSAQAQYLGSAFSYNFVEVDYRMTEFDIANDTLDGYRVHASMESNRNIRVMARWGDTTGTVGGLDAKRRDLELGLGFHQEINRSLDSTFDLKFLRSESEANGLRSTETGYGFEMGLRGFVNDYAELNGSLEYRDLFKAEVGMRLGGLVHFTRNIGLGVGYTYFSEQQSLHAGIRFSL